MTRRPEWYRSSEPLRPQDWPRPSISRTIRNSLRALLPEPDVRGKTIVVYARQGLRKSTAWAGLFSEFHAVLGALAYAEQRGAAGVRVDFRSALYVDPAHGPNWWTYFFTCADMAVRAEPATGEVHLENRFAKFGRYGGFCDFVNGTTPYLYPMTYGVSRAELHRLLTAHIHVRDEIRGEVDRIVRDTFMPDAFVVGVHYRGTDAAHSMLGWLNDAHVGRVPYEVYAGEVRRAIASASPGRYQVLVATDEADFLEFMRREFGDDRVLYLADAPRARAGSTGIHVDRTMPVSNYQKGKSGVIDCLLLARSHYLVKGRSNLSDASLVFNVDLPFSFCLM
jgi:hypothetical protein